MTLELARNAQGPPSRSLSVPPRRAQDSPARAIPCCIPWQIARDGNLFLAEPTCEIFQESAEFHCRLDNSHCDSSFSRVWFRANDVALAFQYHLASRPLELHRKSNQFTGRAYHLRYPEVHPRCADIARNTLGVLQENRQCGMDPLAPSFFRMFFTHFPRYPPV